MPPTHVVLIGCSDSKLSKPAPARALYTGELFKLSLRYADVIGARAFVVSAKHGLVGLDDVVEPYDFTATSLRTVREREEWVSKVVSRLERSVPMPSGIEVLLGEAYAKHLRPKLKWMANPDVRPAPHTWPLPTYPLHGLAIGYRKRELARLADAVQASSSAPRPPGGSLS